MNGIGVPPILQVDLALQSFSQPLDIFLPFDQIQRKFKDIQL